MLNNEGFDKWSTKYDEDILRMQEQGYPFEGYYNTLGYIQKNVIKNRGKKILDMGIGTGLLTEEMYSHGINITGLDFSEQMLVRAKEKMPKGTFIQCDFNLGLPKELKTEKFDFIISSYAIHHITNEKKVEFFKDLIQNLNENGKILIGDIAFDTKEEMETVKKESISKWDSSEYYMIADVIIKELDKKNLKSEFIKTSSCSGVLVINK